MKRISIFSIIILVVFLLTPYINAQGDWSTQVAYDATNRIQYFGRAVPGTATSASLWQIILITYEGATARISTITYAEGSQTHKYIWDDRATYTYS